MTLKRIQVATEWHPGQQAQCLVYLDDAATRLRAMRAEWSGRIKAIYMDPPYMTGDRFSMSVRMGEAGWKVPRGNLSLPTFSDRKNREDFLAMMREVLVECRELLREDGMIFVHIDYRAHPYLRLMMDEIFGEKNFLNEIIWVYQSGGRSVRHFSRKHDVILFYAKSEQYDFNIDAVMAPPATPRNNHMRRHVDADGRTYRSIRTNGKVYTYYDDAPVAPTDVWADLNHLQQKDPERTGYDTQKPLSLLRRVVLCAARPGEWVLDPFAGSGTTLEAARLSGRNSIGIDSCPLTLNLARRRMHGASLRLSPNPADAAVEPVCQVSVQPGVGFYHVTLERFEVSVPGAPETADPMDAVDNWSVGYLREGGVYEVMADFARTRRAPALKNELCAPVYAGQLALCVNDVAGRSYYYAVDGE